MNQKPVFTLSDIASEAQRNIQQMHASIEPVIGIRQQMRQQGIPADVLTIDCNSRQKRITLICHDEQPQQVLMRFENLKTQEEGTFQGIALQDVDAKLIVGWMLECFELVN